MNPADQPTPRTDAATDLYAKQRTDSFLKSGNVAMGVMWTNYARELETELITERARLDYLALNMGTPRVADALDCDYSECFPIRDAIDLAMKNETPTP